MEENLHAVLNVLNERIILKNNNTVANEKVSGGLDFSRRIEFNAHVTHNFLTLRWKFILYTNKETS
jgi:hypothetical protein